MRLIRLCPLLVLLLLLNSATAFAQSSAAQSFHRLKTLVGSWSGERSDGTPVQVTFRSTGAGSALVSELIAGHGNSEDMISVFHLDGETLLVTHYCTAGNQPRMKAAASPDGKIISFNFVDATNLASLNGGHMQSLVIALLDADHHSETWTFMDHGKMATEVLRLSRARIATPVKALARTERATQKI